MVYPPILISVLFVLPSLFHPSIICSCLLCLFPVALGTNLAFGLEDLIYIFPSILVYDTFRLSFHSLAGLKNLG